MKNLNSLKAQGLTKRGRYGDGGGLWLQVSDSGSKSWLLETIPRHSEHVFAIGRNSMILQVNSMNRPGITVHGFRSTFRDWASEQTNFPNDLCEMALAHFVGGNTELAYRRGDMFEKRRQLAESWAQYCEKGSQPAGVVVPMRRADP